MQQLKFKDKRFKTKLCLYEVDHTIVDGKFMQVEKDDIDRCACVYEVKRSKKRCVSLLVFTID